MKLVVQIPCLNEESTLPATLRDIPRKISGIDRVEILVIDDGSTDKTSAVAKESGADHIERLTTVQGLGHAFAAGIETALRLGADIIVNTDGDHQYRGQDIPDLIRPILEGRAGIVIGDRQVAHHKEFGFLKKIFQKAGNFVVRQISGLPIVDATSGFRALSRDAAMRLNLKIRFSHTLETIVFAAKEGIPIVHVSVQTNPASRPSRLSPSMWSYIKQSASSLVRIYLLYEPFKTFAILASSFLVLALIFTVRFFYFLWIIHAPDKHPTLIFAVSFALMAFLILTIGCLADLVSQNIRIGEKQLLLMKTREREHSS